MVSVSQGVTLGFRNDSESYPERVRQYFKSILCARELYNPFRVGNWFSLDSQGVTLG
jgi:hypothetical protein